MDQKLNKEFGSHYIVELFDCNKKLIKNVVDVETAFLKAAKLSEATILSHAMHQFKPYGVSGMIFIAESHFSIHTWPDDGYVALDILTCGQMYPQRAIDHMKKEFGAQGIKTQVIVRGY